MSAVTEPLTLTQYVQQQRRQECPVCQLPDDTRRQMAGATDRGIKRAVVLAWLEAEHKVKIADSDLTSHYSGKHDAA